jgi:hypothetical protein
MGGLSEIVVAIVGAPALAVLATSLQVWLTQRRSDVSLELTDLEGRTIKLSVNHLEDGGELVERVIRLVEQQGKYSANPWDLGQHPAPDQGRRQVPPRDHRILTEQVERVEQPARDSLDNG